MTEPIRLVAAAADDGRRLDQYLTDQLPDLSRAQIQKLIAAGAATVDSEPPARGTKTKVREGAEIELRIPPPAPIALEPEPIPLTILYQDADIVVVDKSRDLVVHPALGHPRGTLINALLYHVEDFEHATEDQRPGIVHRLDRDTTGVMVVAKHRKAQQRLVGAFQARAVEKNYVAVCRGVPRAAKATIDTWFGRHPTDRKRFSSKLTHGKRAVTHYEIRERFIGAARLDVRIETGRTHQIRVHLTDSGHPLIGDPTYGRRRRVADPRIAPIFEAFDRPALHAARIALAHPMSGAPMVFEAPLPDDLADLLDALRGLSEAVR